MHTRFVMPFSLKLSTILAGLVLVVLSSFVLSHDASAGREVNSRLSYGDTNAYCWNAAAGRQHSARGMVWISNDNSDYYSERVYVGPNDNYAGVMVRGALNTCTTAIQDSGNNQVWAAGVQSQTGRLGINGTEFYRGNISRYAQYEWSYGHDWIPGNHLTATLDVSGVAVCTAANAGGTATGTVGVGIYRYLQWRQEVGGVWNYYNVGDGTEWFDVPVYRSCPLNFQLNPSISVTPNVAETGTSVNYSPTINNSGSTNSSGAQWQVTRFVVAPGGGIPGAGVNGNVPTTHYGNGAATIGSGTGTYGPGNTAVGTGSQVIADYPVGTRVCFALSVQPYRHDNGNWNHSAPACIVVAKSPKVQVLSGDLQVGRGSATNPAPTSGSRVQTSVTNKTGTYYGSWAEYAIIPTGCVSGMASGSGYAGGATTSNLTMGLSLLTFTQPGAGACAGSVGGYVQTSLAPNVSARFPINTPAASAGPGRPANPAVLPSGTIDLAGGLSGHYQAQAGMTNITVTGGDPIPAGRWIVVNAPGATVTITGNIRYTTGALTSMSQIPQVIIIANNIIIADNVTQVDAWLVAVGNGANGIVNTCGAGGVTQTQNLTYLQCNQRLTVNGPVMANHLVMRRTAGSGTGTQSGDPAEVFNLRADAYIWATNYNMSTGRLSTVESKELPPRY